MLGQGQGEELSNPCGKQCCLALFPFFCLWPRPLGSVPRPLRESGFALRQRKLVARIRSKCDRWGLPLMLTLLRHPPVSATGQAASIECRTCSMHRLRPLGFRPASKSGHPTCEHLLDCSGLVVSQGTTLSSKCWDLPPSGFTKLFHLLFFHAASIPE